MHKFSPKDFFDLTEVPFADLFLNVSFTWDVLKKLEEWLKKMALGEIYADISPKASLIDPEMISIGRGSFVEPGAYIKGPCVIGEGCTIRHGAYIRGNVICGNNVVIGHGTEVKNCIFLNGAKAAHLSYVGDSILGNHVNLGAGTKIANLKFDHGEVIVHVGDKSFNTGLKKFGAILGDFAQTGCNSVTNPGTIFEKGATCFPCVNASGVIPAGFALNGEKKLVQFSSPVVK